MCEELLKMTYFLLFPVNCVDRHAEKNPDRLALVWEKDEPNCVDRHAEKNPDRLALVWEKDEPGKQQYITYRWVIQIDKDLRVQICGTGQNIGSFT